jgi:hypothetical protein
MQGLCSQLFRAPDGHACRKLLRGCHDGARLRVAEDMSDLALFI